MLINDMNTMDVDTDYEPTDSAEPVVDATVENPVRRTVWGITHQLSINRQPTCLTITTTQQKSAHEMMD